ncbi:hypothetical protein D3C80_1136790 [compost metagenome]
MNTALLVELLDLVFKHCCHHPCWPCQGTFARQQRTQAQGLRLHARIAVIGQTLEVSREVALVGHAQNEAWHRWIQTVARRVAALLNRSCQARLGVGRIGPAIAAA